MKHDELRILLTQKMSKEDILTFSKIITPHNFDKIFPFIADENKELSANVAYILLNASEKTKIRLSRETNFIIDVVQTTTHEKSKRLLLSLLEKLKIDTINIKFLDYCFDNIVSAKSPCAIRVLCIKLAHKQSAQYPELLSELKIILESMDNSTLSPSVTCVKKNTLKRINSILYR